MNMRVLSAVGVLGATFATLYACSSTEVQTVVVDGGTTTVFVDGGTTTVLVDGGTTVVQLPFDGGQLGDAGASTCANDASVEPLGPGMYGCPGSVRYEDRGSLCGAGAAPCGGLAYLARLHPSKEPTHNYWLAEGSGTLKAGDSNACVVGGGGKTCAVTTGGTPMRVCAGATDPEGNVCNWSNCGYETTTNQYFGGCSGNTTAGALCCPNAAAAASGCASASDSQTFSNGMAGCAGKVTWSNRASLCAAGYHTCSAAEWNANRGATAPTHNYWTEDLLRYSGSGTNNCSVSTTTGTDCGGFSATATAPAHLCPKASDTEGNQCAVTGCGVEVANPNRQFGASCAPDASAPAGDADGGLWHAGTVCCGK